MEHTKQRFPILGDMDQEKSAESQENSRAENGPKSKTHIILPQMLARSAT